MALRRLRFTRTAIAELLGMPVSTMSGILTRIGLGRLGRLGLEPAERYERERPGELIHINIMERRMGAGQVIPHRPQDSSTSHRCGRARSVQAGWEFVTSRSMTSSAAPTLSTTRSVFARRSRPRRTRCPGLSSVWSADGRGVGITRGDSSVRRLKQLKRNAVISSQSEAWFAAAERHSSVRSRSVARPAGPRGAAGMLWRSGSRRARPVRRVSKVRSVRARDALRARDRCRATSATRAASARLSARGARACTT